MSDDNAKLVERLKVGAPLTQEFVRQCFRYERGRLFWVERPLSHFPSNSVQRQFNKRFSGKEAGSKGHRYYELRVAGRNLKLHRIIYLWHHGFIPQELDHMDGNKHNNKIENLRPVTRSQNRHNSAPPNTNKSGRTGVHWDRDLNKWKAEIRIQNKYHNLGRFDDFESACAARSKAEQQYWTILMPAADAAQQSSEG